MKKTIERKSKGPDFIKYFKPIVEVLKDLGGSGKAAEVTDAIIERHGISEDELSQTNKDGGSTVRNRIAWARFYLVKGGIIDSSKRGVWSLTERGFSEEIEDSNVFFRDVHKLFETKASDTDDDGKVDDKEVDDVIDQYAASQSHRDKLLGLLQRMSPSGFEKICQRLLRESGFTQVQVTGKSGDGGIDGYGLLEINPLLSFKVMFQSKRYTNSIGPDKIRDFRGAIAGRADRGIFITTSWFTSEAKKESVRDGADPVELVDGERLVDLFEKLELGVHIKNVYEIDTSFFEEYLD